jgi:hypothetical protein
LLDVHVTGAETGLPEASSGVAESWAVSPTAYSRILVDGVSDSEATPVGGVGPSPPPQAAITITIAVATETLVAEKTLMRDTSMIEESPNLNLMENAS